MFSSSSSSIRSSLSRVASRAAGRRAASTSSSGGGVGGLAMPLALISLGTAGYVYNDCQSKVDAMETQIDLLQSELSGKTNSGKDSGS